MQRGGVSLLRVLRPKKKARRESASPTSEKDSSLHPMYFDLCLDANENIVRFLSSKPKTTYWEKHVHAEDACPVYEMDSELGKFMSIRFKSIFVSSRKYTLNYTGNWIAVNKKNVASKIDNLESVLFHLDEADETISWIEQFGPSMSTLRSIRYVGPEIMTAISLHCTNLKEIGVSGSNMDLQSMNIWESLGKTLEVLSLGLDSSREEEMRKIKKHCRSLKSIHIYANSSIYWDGSALNTAALSRCLISYGGQLEHIGIRDMGLSNLEDVVRV